MRRRLLTLTSGILIGFLLAGAAVHFAFSWNFFPDRKLNRSSDYVREVMRLVHDNYVDPKTSTYDDLAHQALHGMVESLDPHSEFMEAADFKDLDDEMHGDFGGIGIQVEARNGRIVVIAPIAGTPGARAGIRRGDELVAVDGVAFDRNTNMDDVVDRLRGAPGTKVSLRVYRPETHKNLNFTITRELIKVKSVRDVRVLPGGIGYLQITEFSERTGDEFDDALDSLLKQGIHSLILDLRNNPGGLLDAAVYVAEPFFKKGDLIVYTQGRNPGDRDDLRSENDQDPLDMPIAVLINAGTASAAEIVAGALKDTHKAVIVGERSFGKGSVQTIFKLRNGEGMRLTTALYYTPSGISILGKGIVPDIKVVMSAEDDAKLQLQQSRDDLKTPAQFKSRFGFDPIPDRQLEAAVDALTGMDILRARMAQQPQGAQPAPAPAGGAPAK
ncbi:putative CtpA-like serine protease [mine drainage metagenome]|uniref:Putative CtpA-like serine protease n=1 Tax=mine drainage metagenome TaxID=410659 RepID=A0A1J5TQS5_9ZZZZ